MTKTITRLLTVSLFGFGCAHDPSVELVAARETYQKASEGPAGTNAKAEVYDAKKALDRAEQAHRQRSGSAKEIDRAYVALRKSSNAIAHSDYLKYQMQAEQAKAQYLATLEKQKDGAEGRLENVQDELDAKRKDLVAAEAARRALEAQLMGALASLSDMAKIKQDDQRTVITLNGAVLFRSDDTELLPIAREKLVQVAEVLEQYGDEYTITVNGHTDSRGTDSHNQRLSQGRADSVRSYLVTSGVPSGSVKAFGLGETQPVAGNSTPEGRADNRRVEIVVDRNGSPALGG